MSKPVQRHEMFALGSVQWGLDYGVANRDGRPSDAELSSLLRKAQQSGVKTIDTAHAYGCAEAVLASLGANVSFRVVTKLNPDLKVPTEVDESLAQSRSRLNSEVLDTVLFHRGMSTYSNSVELWKRLVHAKRSGLVNRIGLSAMNPSQAWQALELDELDTVQVASSLLDRRLYSAGFFELAQERGLEVFVRSVYIQGLAHLPSHSLPGSTSMFSGALKSLDVLAREVGLERWQIFLCWAKQRLKGTLILGQETRAQLNANLEAWNQIVPDDVLERAEAAATLARGAPLDPSTWTL